MVLHIWLVSRHCFWCFWCHWICWWRLFSVKIYPRLIRASSIEFSYYFATFCWCVKFFFLTIVVTVAIQILISVFWHSSIGFHILAFLVRWDLHFFSVFTDFCLNCYSTRFHEFAFIKMNIPGFNKMPTWTVKEYECLLVFWVSQVGAL